MREGLKYCIVLPAHNEGRHLQAVISDIPDWVDGIVVVDDASTDNTLEVAQNIDDPRIQVLHNERNLGVGGAMVAGFRAALAGEYDVIVKMDADGQMEVRELSKLVRPIELGMAEYAKGDRFQSTGRPPSMPRTRWFGNVALSFLTKVASGYWHVFDSQCGFLAITSAALSRLRLDKLAQDYYFENDMLVNLNVIGARVVDVGTSALYGEEESYVRVSRVLWSFPLRLARSFFWRFFKRHVINEFGLVALLAMVGSTFVLFGTVFGIVEWVSSASAGSPATTGTVMIAVLPLMLGVQMLLQSLALEVQDSPGANETRLLSYSLSPLDRSAADRDRSLGRSKPDQ